MMIKNHGIYHNSEYTFLENKEVEQVQPVQMNIYQNNTYGKDLTWQCFSNEPRVQKWKLGKDQQSCISTFVAYLTCPSSNQEHQPRHDHGIPCIAVCQIYRDTLQEVHRTSQGSNFLGRNFSDKDNVTVPIQFTIENEQTPLKRLSFFKSRPIHFHINSTCVIRLSNETSFVFPALNSTSHFLLQSTVSHRSDSSSETNFSCCH